MSLMPDNVYNLGEYTFVDMFDKNGDPECQDRYFYIWKKGEELLFGEEIYFKYWKNPNQWHVNNFCKKFAFDEGYRAGKIAEYKINFADEIKNYNDNKIARHEIISKSDLICSICGRNKFVVEETYDRMMQKLLEIKIVKCAVCGGRLVPSNECPPSIIQKRNFRKLHKIDNSPTVIRKQ